MSDVTTNAAVVNSGVPEQVAQAVQLSAEQQADIMAEAKKELGLVVKALRSGNRENIVSQYLAGLPRDAVKVLEDYRKNMRSLVDQAATVAREAKAAEQEALDSEKKADKGTARLEKRRSEADNGRDLPWQALGENAAEKSTAKDLAEALYGIVAKHPEPEDVLYAMITLHRKDASNAFKQALQAFGVTWERKTRPAEKVRA